jgi:hypothetical protein
MRLARRGVAGAARPAAVRPARSATRRTNCDVAQVAVVCTGAPGRGMGWYHAEQLLAGRVPAGRLTDIVEPYYLGPDGGEDRAGAAAFAGFRASAEAAGVRFFEHVCDMPAGRADAAKVRAG